MRSLITALYLSLLPVMSFAAEHAASAHGDHVPKTVMYQAINITILFVILYFATRKKIPAFFKARYEDFMKQATEAARIKKDLEDKKADLLRRTELLRKTAIQSIEDSKRDAEKMFMQEIEKAKVSAQKIEKDALNVLAVDEQKLSEKLRLEALEMSVSAAEEQLNSAGASEKSRLNTQFNERVQGAVI